MADFYDAIKLVESGSDPDTAIDFMLAESSLKGLVATGAALSAGYYLVKGIQKSSDEAAFRMAVGQLISTAVTASSNAITRLYAWGASKVFPEIDSKGDKTTWSVQFVQSPEVIQQRLATGAKSQTGSGRGKSFKTDIVNPNIGLTNIADIEQVKIAGGQRVSVYRVDPVSGVQKGAPIKTFTIRHEGNNPKDLERIQNGLERSLLTLARGIAKGQTRVPKNFSNIAAYRASNRK